jgi:ribonuclease D
VQTDLRTPVLVDTDAGLAEVARALGGASTYFLDTEFESNRDGKTLSLLQVSAGGDVHLVDALKLRRLAPLGHVLGRPEVTWVLHAGLQDVELLADRLPLRELPRLFDTQVAWALLGPEASVSLAYLQYRLLGLRAMKPHQADDWMRRPLPRSQLEYAASDIAHLPELHRALIERATELDRADLITAASREILLPVPDDSTATLSLASFRNAWQLDPPAQAALRFLIEWQRTLPAPERGAGLGMKTLLAIAGRLPNRAEDIARIKGVPERWARRHGKAVAAGIQQAVVAAEASHFVPLEPPAYATWPEVRTDGWLSFARAEVSARAQVAPELAFTGRVLRGMREVILESGDPAAGARALDGWRERLLRGTYEQLCEALAPELAGRDLRRAR